MCLSPRRPRRCGASQRKRVKKEVCSLTVRCSLLPGAPSLPPLLPLGLLHRFLLASNTALSWPPPTRRWAIQTDPPELSRRAQPAPAPPAKRQDRRRARVPMHTPPRTQPTLQTQANTTHGRASLAHHVSLSLLLQRSPDPPSPARLQPSRARAPHARGLAAQHEPAAARGVKSNPGARMQGTDIHAGKRHLRARACVRACVFHSVRAH